MRLFTTLLAATFVLTMAASLEAQQKSERWSPKNLWPIKSRATTHSDSHVRPASWTPSMPKLKIPNLRMPKLKMPKLQMPQWGSSPRRTRGRTSAWSPKSWFQPERPRKDFQDVSDFLRQERPK